MLLVPLIVDALSSSSVTPSSEGDMRY